uniref:Glucosidase II subunit alpha n=1 Tax=Rhodosorus marinus TaxID=101924 RepID=A0A7S3E5R7_9RHOD|mmetsp:Transcript_11072/g.46212  ORF Transcript_11072/g.46212 Transcript_11072/m.46212 type:complete len:975 (+) Transcript_11072:164-3088(+)
MDLRRTVFWCLLFSLIAISLSASWKNICSCSEVGFCRRHFKRDPIEPQPVVERDSVEIGKWDSHSVTGLMSTAGGTKLSLRFFVYVYAVGGSHVFRWIVDDVPEFTNSKRHSVDKVLNPELKPVTLSESNLKVDKDRIVISSPGDPKCETSPCLEIALNPFKVEMTSTDRRGKRQVAITLNDNRMFHFEQHKFMEELKTEIEAFDSKYCKPGSGASDASKESGDDDKDEPVDDDGDEDEAKDSSPPKESSDEGTCEEPGDVVKPECDGCWEEAVKGGFKDPKKRGPESIGMDVGFPSTAHLYGMPERALEFDLKDTGDKRDPMRFYNLDVFEFEMDHTLGLYGSVPYVIGHGDDLSVGMLWLNSAETYSTISSGKEGTRQTMWWSEAGRMDLFLFPGPSPSQIFEQYVQVTGRAAMPNIFSLGYHQCRWNYRDQADVEYVDSQFDAYDIPYDAIWLDIEHTDGKKYFTWDMSKFPDPTKMQNDVAARGRKMVTIVDPHIKIAKKYLMNEIATKNDLYVKDGNGKGDFNGWCWPGNSGYLDFTSARVRNYWMDMYNSRNYPHFTENLHIWNDMNEPSVFNGPEVTMPKNAIHEGGFEHRDVHNIYGYHVMQATFEALVQTRQRKIRPFVLSRSFFAGSQKYGTVWTGDNAATWEQLRSAVPMLLSLSVSGMSFSGADIGGFFGNPSEELLLRWYQLAAFQPFFRAHAHIDTDRREPWEASESTRELIRVVIIERYKYLPHWYSLSAMASRGSGLPFREEAKGPPMRPIWWHFPGFLSEEEQFLVGDSLLVAPNMHEGKKKLTVRLPKNNVWYDLYGDVAKPVLGGELSISSPLNRMAVFQRGGSLIVKRERVRRSSKAMILDPYTIDIAPDGNNMAVGELYADDSVSYDYENGAFALVALVYDGNNIHCEVKAGGSKPFEGSEAVVERIRIFTAGNVRGVKTGDGKYLQTRLVNNVLTVKKPGVKLLSNWTITLE